MKTVKLATLVDREIKDVKLNIHKYIQLALLSIIGLEDRNGRGDDVEIDHCNNRNSLLIDAFRDLAKGEADKIARNYRISKEESVNFQAAFKREFQSQMSYALRDIARQYLIEQSAVLLEELKQDLNKEIKKQLKAELLS